MVDLCEHNTRIPIGRQQGRQLSSTLSPAALWASQLGLDPNAIPRSLSLPRRSSTINFEVDLDNIGGWNLYWRTFAVGTCARMAILPIEAKSKLGGLPFLMSYSCLASGMHRSSGWGDTGTKPFFGRKMASFPGEIGFVFGDMAGDDGVGSAAIGSRGDDGPGDIPGSRIGAGSIGLDVGHLPTGPKLCTIRFGRAPRSRRDLGGGERMDSPRRIEWMWLEEGTGTGPVNRRSRPHV